MDKSYRIHTNISSDTRLNVNLQQDFDFLEVLSLKLKQKDAYRLHSSNYGVIVGRVLANDAFGIPNAKVSVFIEKTDGDSVDMETIYPYNEVTTKDKDGRRYNILPDYSDDECYRVVGTFPNKRLVLDDDVQLDVYEKYWKYSTVTNNAGDFMLFAVPTGSVTVHIEMDLSDIGLLSQKPRDFEYKGYNLTLFDSPSQFKESTNLDDLAQIFSQNKSIFVYPFWGDADNGVACITRSDVQIQYKFEPTCVFMGSIVSDNEGHAIGHKCAPDVDNGLNTQLIGGNGTIEMIRKTTDGLVEEYQIQGNQLIDEHGVWCYQIPMNLDYVGTDEYGNVVPTDNPNKGIPTRTQVRFRFSKNETSDEGFSKHTAKYLVPMNPIFDEKKEIPTISDKGSEIEKMYVFGSATPASCFRDLYWNNVYSVKNYLPKTQVATKPYSKNFCGLKGANIAENQNQIPFNKLSISLPFVYIALCLIYTIVMWIIKLINSVIICTLDKLLDLLWSIKKKRFLGITPFSFLPVPKPVGCISLSAGELEGNIAYYPGCCKVGMKYANCPEEMKSGCEKSTNDKELMDKIQRNLATEFKIIRLDFYQDWINGCLYMPLWYWRKRKKKSFLFGLIKSKAKNEYCSDNSLYGKLKTYVTCNIKYTDNSLTATNNKNSMPDGEKKWHKTRSGIISYNRGLIKPVENKDGLTAYYYAALQATSNNKDNYLEMSRRTESFEAVRLFATDIILLGSLDPKNLYGIPQFYTCLPSTTSNVPPIATIEESEEPTGKTTDNGAEGDSEDVGTAITTGMDWNNDGGKKSPSYKTGLFMDLACTYANTRPKSCINVERLSELGVSLDMKHNVAYHGGGNDTSYGEIDSDGFITKYELDDIENRAMFATLNHIGFIPQEYQNMHNYYETQVYDTNTNYLVPKFKYLYPLDFDGRAQVPMNLYKKGFEQAMFDEKDEAYLTFRLGAEKDGNQGRTRHFYHVDNNIYDMPLYNNSYYFYFGINKGNTAIDKFNKLFYSPCVQQKKMPFTLDVTSQGRSYCPEAYSGNEYLGSNPYRYIDGVNKNHAYAWIRVTCDDIRPPFTYRLYDAYNNIVVSEDDMSITDFAIGGVVNADGSITCNVDGKIYYQKKGSDNKYHELTSGVYLTNGMYTLDVVDADGRMISEKVKLDVPKISGEYTATALGTRFYNSATTRIDYICNDDNAFYGEIEMDKFYVDGYSCDITEIGGNYDFDTNTYHFCITGKSDNISENVYAQLEFDVLNNDEENLVRNCLCDNDGSVNLVKAAQNSETAVHMNIAPKEGGTIKKNFYLEKRPTKDDNGEITGYSLILYVYQPNQYVMKITQGCGSCDALVSDNSSTEIVNVLNGEPFMTELNGMPTKFMIGTSTDTTGASIANSSFFYNSNAVTSEANMNIKGWYGLHQEDSYMFSKREENKTYMSNQNMWEDFLDGLNIDVATPDAKREILKFKFDNMFALAEGAYITTNSSRSFTFSSQGGKQPILYRSVIPVYNDETKINDTYILEDFFGSDCRLDAPNIVAYNYSTEGKNLFAYDHIHGNGTIGPHFNKGIYTTSSGYVGNYFAAFTRDGSYVTKKDIDGKKIKIERSPSLASISPIKNNILKVKGKDMFGGIEDYFHLAHTKGEQTLTGDIGQRNTLPYLRGMYVDRRLDFDLTILAPNVSNTFNLHSVSDNPNVRTDKNRIWKGGRIFGWLFNGIEMSYDENYNIISANTISGLSEDGEIVYSAATFNKRLEYTYKYDCSHICTTCGYQSKGMTVSCPTCSSDTVNHFHGENVENVPIREIDGVTYYKGGKHLQDTVNFNTSDTITGKILNGNDKKYTLDDAITWYHRWSGDTEYDWKNNDSDYARWGNWNSINYEIPIYRFNESSKKWEYDYSKAKTLGYSKEDDGGEENPNLQNIPLIKEFYSSYINGIDIKHLYWSLFNYKRLGKYTSSFRNNNQGGSTMITNVDLPLYVYHYPYTYVRDNGFNVVNGLFNGDFNRDDVVQNENIDNGRKKTTQLTPYPTKRFIDIGNLQQTAYYTFETECCSYDVNTEITDDGRIVGETSGGESIELDFEWNPPITIVPPSPDNTDYANVLYKNIEVVGGYSHFISNKVSIAFKYNKCSHSDFDIYTSLPQLIRVLPEIGDIDGIGYYKTSNPGHEFGGYGDKPNETSTYAAFNSTISDILIDPDAFVVDSSNKWIVEHGDFIASVFTPSGVKIANGYKTKYGDEVTDLFFIKDDEWLTSDDDDFENIMFKRSNIELSGTTVFTVLVPREYRYTEDDKLLRRIRTYETADLYDCRDLYLRGISCSKSACTDTNCSIAESYVECKLGDVDGEGSGATSGESAFYQTLCFEMRFDISNDTAPKDRQNEAFADYDMMSYTFRFFDKKGQKFDVSPTNVVKANDCNGTSEDNKHTLIRFTVQWTADMGIMCDAQWQNSGKVEIYAKTSSNFVYKIPKIGFKFGSGGQENPGGYSYDKPAKVKKSIESEPTDGSGSPIKYLTDFIIA